MANIDNIKNTDTSICADFITSKYDEKDNVEVLSMRGFVFYMEELVEIIDSINKFGVDNETDESIEKTMNTEINKRFLLDVVKSQIIQHTKECLKRMENNI